MRACSSCRGDGNGGDEEAEAAGAADADDEAGADICTQTQRGKREKQ